MIVSGDVVETGTSRLTGELRDGVLRLTLANEPKLNALTLDMLVALKSVARQAADDHSVRAVTMTGAGNRAFASGVDLTSLATVSPGREHSDADALYHEALQAVSELSRPTIAVIRGYCIGGGLALALSADIRFCDETAQFAIPAARIGLGYPDVRPLVEIVGPGWAAEILFTGRRLSSQEAVQAGLVNRAVDSTELTTCTDDLATAIASNAPLSVAAAKVALRESRKDITQRNQAEVDRLVAACASSDDYVEGREAFAQRRRPNFQGR